MALASGQFDFNRIVYKGPRPSNRTRYITAERVLGFDSESDREGKPLVFALSDGTVIEPHQFPHRLLTRRFRGRHFLCWNIKFEEGAIFRLLPVEVRMKLWADGKAVHEGINYYVVPGKHIRISRPRRSGRGVSCCVYFWDLMPFYGSSLEAAAKKYLQKEKAPIEYDLLTREYYEKNWKEVDWACVQHAELTRELGVLLLETLSEMGIEVSNLYSQASVAAEWFARECGVEDVVRFWKEDRDLLRFACEAYRGGKFEVTSRGFFHYLYEYDINSAYPAQMAKLVSLKNAKVFRQKNPPEGDVVYAFLRCRIVVRSDIPHSVGIRRGPVRLYPWGIFYATVTLPEYEYLLKNGAEIEVYDAYWITVPERVYPYKKAIQKLSKLKLEYRDDPMRYKLVKIIMNGFYGKMVQMILDPVRGKIKAGPYWNPIFAAYITANVRLAVTKIQGAYGRSCRAVHTDSVLVDKPLPAKLVGKELGKWLPDVEGPAVIVSCGAYQVKNKVATRGFRFGRACQACGKWWSPGPDGKCECGCDTPGDRLDWFKFLNSQGKNSRLTVYIEGPVSWREALRIKDPEATNKFVRLSKEIDLNLERKRIWLDEVTAEDLIACSYDGHPVPVFEVVPFWDKPKVEEKPEASEAVNLEDLALIEVRLKPGEFGEDVEL